MASAGDFCKRRWPLFGIENGASPVMYKGNLNPAETFARLQANPNAWLVDVRTLPEWQFVGLPAVERLVRVSWQGYPSMQVNDDFVRKVEDAGVPKDAEVFCICRSGARSAAAAAALTEAGFANCYNVAEGFEGDKDEQGRRGSLGGWKAAGLPWAQN
ncbi:MAG TPA: rhodanese-like domain-containing protein [Aestuariivirgaceae bacterium]|nr:rhodanese-like domain-containing protein [Aestuariivirgaceae bacterium]